MPLHPRLAHVLLRGAELGQARLACELAALLSERELLRGQTVRVHSDLALRLEVLRHGKAALSAMYHSGLEVDEAARAQARRVANDLARRLASPATQVHQHEQDMIGVLVALAYPERLAKAAGEGRFVLASGRASQLDRLDVLAQGPWLAVAHVGLNDAQGGNARVFLAAKISQAAIEQHFGEQIVSHASVEWDARAEAVSARAQRRLGNLLLEDKALSSVPAEAMQAALLQGIRATGLSCLPWQEAHQQWRGRVMLLRRVMGETWPDVSDKALLARLDDWLAPFVQGMNRLAHLERLDMNAALRAILEWSKQAELERLAPTHLSVPSGSQIALDYAPILEGAAQPVLAVKLQELFGQADTPRVLDGRVAVMIHLLSPAQKPLAVTQDLASFWRGAYQDVRKDMRGRYPRHPWPEDPQNAVPTKLTKRALERVMGEGGGG
jgi:ATP-dependent helicase HrpB